MGSDLAFLLALRCVSIFFTFPQKREPQKLGSVHGSPILCVSRDKLMMD